MTPEQQPQPTPIPTKLDPVDRVLVALIVFFALVLVGLLKLAPANGQTFQVFCSALSTVLGAFVTRMIPSKRTTDNVTPPAASGGAANP
jgi:hypothetical protein